MTTSGQVNFTTIDVIGIIEKAVRKCGKMPAMVDSETLDDAASELWVILSALPNVGVPLWTVEKQIYGVHRNQNLIQFSSGTIDVRNCLYRTNTLPSGGTPDSFPGGVAANAFDQDVTTACTQTAPSGYISYNFQSPVVISTVGLLPNSTQTINPVFEYSADGAAWTQAAPLSSAASSFTAGTWYWQDIDNLSFGNTAQYFRVRETSGIGVLDMTEVVFGTAPYSLPMARVNQDDYQNLPNKQGNNGRPLQYWFDKQMVPQMWLWPSSAYEFNSIEVWRRREIQDVGALTNQIELPNRWLDALIWEMAFRLALLPNFAVDPNRLSLLKSMRDPNMMTTSPWTEERDPSPVYFQAGIRGYTR